MDSVELNRLAAVIKAMSSTPWRVGDPPDSIVDGADQLVMYADGEADINISVPDQMGIITLRNAADELLRLARVGAAYIAARESPFGTSVKAGCALDAAYRAATEVRHG